MARPRILLHLTDLHFGAPPGKGHYWNSESTELKLPEHDRRGLLGSLARDLLEEQEIAPDLVIVTGDLLDRGSAAGVPMAVAFLSGLCERLALPRGRVVLVPGNHDVSRAAEPAERYASFDRLWRDFYGPERPAMGPETRAHHRVVRFDYSADLGIEVVGFNSCEALDPGAGWEHGSIGQAQRDRADALLRPTRGQGLFRIAALHHHLATPAGVVRDDYSVMDDAALTLRWLAARRFGLALHGHQHVDWQEIREIDGFFVTIAAGGSAGVASYGRSEWMLQLGYQIIVLESASSGRRIRREYDPQTRAWVPAGKGASEQALRFGPGAAVDGRGLLNTPLRRADAGELHSTSHEAYSAGAPRMERDAGEGIPSSLILSAALRQRVLDIALGVRWPRASLLHAYVACAPPGQAHDFDRHEDGELVKRMLIHLSTALRQSDGTHPLLTFAWYLVKIASAVDATEALVEAAGPLSDWFHDAAASLRLEGAAVLHAKQRVEDDLARRGDRELYLLLALTESAKERERYAVRAFRVLVSPSSERWADEDVEPIGDGGTSTCSLDELPALVSELIQEISGDLMRANNQLTIELFVPLKLLSCKADQWSFDNGMVLSVLGAEYRVIVRSWDRAYNPRCAPIVPRWHARWQKLRASPKGAFWPCERQHVGGDGAALRHAAGGEPACVALCFVPHAEERDGIAPLLQHLIGTGTPVAVWPRHASCDGAALRGFLASTRANDDIFALREEVQRLRREALGEGDRGCHPGSHLALLWDDPDKLPPDATGRARFTTPRRAHLATPAVPSKTKDSTP